jgi:hypothetical protein
MAAQILRQTVQFLHISVFPESLHQEIKICSAAGGWRDKPLCRIRSAEGRILAILIQIVHFDESNSGGVVYATYDCGVVT